MKMSVEQFSSAIQAAYVEGYVQGSMHPKGKRVIPKATELAWLFWRVVEERIMSRRKSASRESTGT